jgi:outer membrane protein assembly factor BamB
MRITRKLVGVGVLALMTGCSTLNSLNPFAIQIQGQPAGAAGRTEGHDGRAHRLEARYRQVANYQFSPALAGNTVIVAGADGSIARVEAADGRQLWRVKAGSDLTAGVGTDGNVIAVGGAEGVLLAFDMDGKALWKAQLSSEILSPGRGAGHRGRAQIDNRIVGIDAPPARRNGPCSAPRRR